MEHRASKSTTYGVLPRSGAEPMPDLSQPLRWPSQRHRVPTRCSREHCGGWISVDPPSADHPRGDATCGFCSQVACELIHDGYRQMTATEFRALADQKHRAQGPRTDVMPCPECGLRQIRTKNACCLDCYRERRDETTQTTQLVRLLSDGLSYPRAALCEAIKVRPDGLRQIINKARSRGYPIARERGAYRLEVAP